MRWRHTSPPVVIMVLLLHESTWSSSRLLLLLDLLESPWTLILVAFKCVYTLLGGGTQSVALNLIILLHICLNYGLFLLMQHLSLPILSDTLPLLAYPSTPRLLLDSEGQIRDISIGSC
jgi:hypothetical protein